MQKENVNKFIYQIVNQAPSLMNVVEDLVEQPYGFSYTYGACPVSVAVVVNLDGSLLEFYEVDLDEFAPEDLNGEFYCNFASYVADIATVLE